MDDPALDDNRSYVYNPGDLKIRAEYEYIAGMTEPRARVIDLGCGAGDLLLYLSDKKQISGSGLEISRSGVDVCLTRGLACRQGTLDEALPFGDNEFDIAICNVTLQMVNYPEKVIREMKRIARKLIISIPNFAFIANRFELFFGGRMPRKMLFGYEWYNTGHIHQMSLNDFKDLIIRTGGLKINDIVPVKTGNILINLLAGINQNLFHHISVIEIEKLD